MEEALKALEALTKQFEDFKTKHEKSVGNKIDKEQFDTVSKMIEDLNAKVGKIEEAKLSDALAKINKQLEEMAEDVAQVKEGGRSVVTNKSFGQMVVDKLREEGISSKMKKGERKSFEVNVSIVNKLAGTMTTSNVSAVGTNAIPFSLTQVESGLTRIVRRRPWLMEIANTSPTNKMYVQWAEQENPDGAANETAEGSTKNQIDFDWVEKSQKVEKITTFIKTSKENLDDLDGLRSEIDAELIEQVMLKTDTDLLNGDGTTPSIAGLLTFDTAFDAGDLAGLVRDPNRTDAIRAAINQVVKNQFIPNYVLLHPDDVALMDLEKGSDGHYVMAPFKSANGMIISGVTVLENTGQTAGNFTVGDFTKFNVRVREGVNIDVGHDGNDFTKNLITILAEIRLAAYVKANHAGAFVSGDFSTAIAALDSGS